ncbi:MAG TPA: hypothetical protein VK666_21695 [Chryseolinea sp.]|nr:hypothetical protein [Chryseolinea sp.]
MNQQIALAKIAQEKNRIMADRLGRELDERFFPNDKLTDLWRDSVALAIAKSAPISHRLSLLEYAKVVASDPQENQSITLFQFAVLTNALETVSRNDLGLTGSEYGDFIGHVAELQHIYEKALQSIKDDIMVKVEEEFKAKDTANGSAMMQAVKDEE